MKPGTAPFTCPRCGHEGQAFRRTCPACGRPYVRDYIDTQLHPRDPDTTGIWCGKFWAQVFLVVVLLGLAIHALLSFGIIW